MSRAAGLRAIAGGGVFSNAGFTSHGGVINEALATLRRQHPDLNFEIVAAPTFFALFKEFEAQQREPIR